MPSSTAGWFLNIGSTRTPSTAVGRGVLADGPLPRGLPVLLAAPRLSGCALEELPIAIDKADRNARGVQRVGGKDVLRRAVAGFSGHVSLEDVAGRIGSHLADHREGGLCVLTTHCADMVAIPRHRALDAFPKIDF